MDKGSKVALTVGAFVAAVAAVGTAAEIVVPKIAIFEDGAEVSHDGKRRYFERYTVPGSTCIIASENGGVIGMSCYRR